MPRNEDGEFELVVGNKQLLSIVFILMVLFGVVFSMGYFVGRANTGTDAQAAPVQQAAAQPPGRPQAAGAEAAGTPTAADTTPDASLPPGDAKVTTPDTGVTTTPVAATSPAAAQTPAATPPPPVPTPKASATLPPAAKTAGAGPGPGTYLQVAAVKKPQAEMLVEVLKEKGFRAQTVPLAPGGELYRTLVGPLRDSSEVARTKADLENAGFKPIIKRF